MQAQLIRYLDQTGHFKATLANTTQLGRDAHRRLQASPMAIQLITQAMTAALLLSSESKTDSTLSMKFVGDGPCGHITVEANSLGEVRGFAGNLNVDFKTDKRKGLFEQAIGQGNLVCRRRLANKDKVYTSTVQLIPGEMAANVANYLLQSEQVHSAMALGAQLDPDLGIAGSGGILIQALPNADENVLLIVEDRLTTLPHIGATFALDSAFKSVEKHIFEDFGVQRVARLPLKYRCNCSKDRVIHLLASLPQEQMASLLQDELDVTLQCQFCTKPYTFSPQELKTINSRPEQKSQ